MGKALDPRTGGAGRCSRARDRRSGRSGTPPPRASPVSTGSASAKTRFETLPVDVMTTTISTCGCSTRTSTWRTVAVWRGGADTRASRRVAWEEPRSSPAARPRARCGRPRVRAETGWVAARAARAANRRRSDIRPRSALARQTCADASGDRAARARPTRREPSRRDRHARVRDGSSTQRAGRSRRTPRRRPARSRVTLRQLRVRCFDHLFAGILVTAWLAQARSSAVTAPPRRLPRGVRTRRSRPSRSARREARPSCSTRASATSSIAPPAAETTGPCRGASRA